MKKCCFIVPFFGKMPKNFSLFLKTCEYNRDFNWLIITDDNTKYIYPPNVKKINMTFNEVRELIQSKFDFKIALPNPYKLCDFRPAYGFLFEDYIRDFRFWGYCDLDILIGNIGKFITEELFDQYDKFFCLGHMALYRNNTKDNKLFMSKINGEYWYKEVFTNPSNMIFDEDYKNIKNIHNIYLENGKKTFDEDLSINFNILPTKFIKITYKKNIKAFISDKKSSIYLWENGDVCRYILENGELKREEYLYIHLQERKMNLDKNIENSNIIKIIPNRFTYLEVKKITKENFNKIKKRTISLHFFQYHYKWKKKRVKEILRFRK